MFAQTFVNTGSSGRKPWTIAASLGIQTAVVLALLIVPLLHPEILQVKIQKPVWVPTHLVTQPVPVAIPKAPAMTRTSAAPVFRIPTSVPTSIAEIRDIGRVEAPETGVYIPGAGGPAAMGLPAGSSAFLALPDKPPAPKPAAVQPKAPEGPVRVGGSIQAAKLLFYPHPPYPPMARMTRVEGTVKLQAIISPEGNITRLQVMSGHPLLSGAAVDAVKQWRYQPTLLNGMPVEVLTEIDVIFTLSR